ncbi:MAG: PAS domain-containing protein, partial [Gemmatimonadota bacterium]
MDPGQSAGVMPRLYIDMEDLPVGCYKVDSSSGNEIIVSCNQYFAQLFDFASPSDVVGTDIKDLHGSTAQYNRFLTTLRSEHARGNYLQMFKQRLKTRTGRILLVEIHCRLVLDALGREVGRVGVIRDLTPEMQVALRGQELTKDFGNVLHSFSQFLLMLSFASLPALSALSRGIRDKHPGEVDVTILSDLALELARQVEYVVKQPIVANVAPAEMRQLRKL